MEKKHPVSNTRDWEKFYTNKNDGKTYPSEFIVRIFMGRYPRLDLRSRGFRGARICDVGCGDGRNMVLFRDLQFRVHGVEIAGKIVDKAKAILRRHYNFRPDIRVGQHVALPFRDAFFDYLVAWNSCYYVTKKDQFKEIVAEYARVMKPDAYLLLSIPKRTNYLFWHSRKSSPGYRQINRDWFGVLDKGVLVRAFRRRGDIARAFSRYFDRFKFASGHNDVFGISNHHHIVVCQRKHL